MTTELARMTEGLSRSHSTRKIGTTTELSQTGLKKPLGTGPVTAVTGVTGPARFRFRAVQTGAKFKF